MKIKEITKLLDLKFKVVEKYGIIWVFFYTPLISPLLREFLERSDFMVSVNDKGMTVGIWASGMYPAGEYNKLREEFKEYGVELPAVTEL